MEDNKLISKSFIWMCIGLLTTFVTGFGVASNEKMLANIFSGGFYWVCIIADLLVVLLFQVYLLFITYLALCMYF